MQKIILALTASALAAACTHQVAVDDITVTNRTIVPSAEFDQRVQVAEETCEAQYEGDKQNYLAAVETRIAAKGEPDATKAPLDAFRAEINAAYNNVVQRCKTHMHCLEVQRYDEGKCYMAASDRKDAERRFSDLAETLRRIENRKKKSRHGKKRPPVTINNNIEQDTTQTQTQSNESKTGDKKVDQDILMLCGNARGLLDRRCRKPCRQC
ncbi:hypothetical protein [Hyphococcus luteus]|uniref:Lysozyme inhibitor LprI N-terminal domain-containing protein n=1 Tax=Hyphococcus luteus TaxID=2058213 RepID=A0A2S7JZD3_9PROT|nr:hypothetical protein [Marinicaulis flavus]PQA85619.1 hypothetical protein CW354_22050 [Marinicaulis flavus]